MEKTVKQRLIEFIESKGLSKKKFEETINVSNGYVNNLKSQPRDEIIKKILLNYPDLNRVWLLTGEGPMLATGKSGAVEVVPVANSELTEYSVTKNGTRFSQREDGKIVMEVPILPIEALGSPEDEFATLITDYERKTAFFEVEEVHQGAYTAFRINGDSMDDGSRQSFERGDVVLVRELARDKWLPRLHFKRWPFWVVVFGNNVRIKQIIDQDELGNITLHSLNPSPEYCDFTLHLDEIQRLFNVIKKNPKTVDYG